MITFKVPAVPCGQPRQRHRVVEAGGRTFAHNYTPQSHPVQAFKASMQHAARAAYNGPPIDAPITLQIEYIFPRPPSRTKKRKPNLREPHTGRPDIDNLLKTWDCLTGILWARDELIHVVTATKWIAGDDDLPGVTISVFWSE